MMTEAEAHAFVRARNQQGVCVRLDRARDGSPRFRDTVPAASLTRRLVPAGLVVSILAVVAAGVSTVYHSTLGGIDSRRPEPAPERDSEQVLVDADPLPAGEVPAPASQSALAMGRRL